MENSAHKTRQFLQERTSEERRVCLEREEKEELRCSILKFFMEG